jgi:hypothetical protein
MVPSFHTSYGLEALSVMLYPSNVDYQPGAIVLGELSWA